MGTLRLLNADRGGEGHAGEIYSCAYAPDGAFVLSGGWDGHLRLWEAMGGTSVVALRASPKPLSCCAFTPDGKQWLSGSMEGMLSFWDALSHQPLQTFMAHTRPISAMRYSPAGQLLATSSWDRQVMLRKIGKEREGKGLTGHKDIVAGCHYSQDGSQLLSWSYDGTIWLWDTTQGTAQLTLTGHEDRVTAGALSPDGKWALSGGRDGSLKFWDLGQGSEAVGIMQVAEIRACFFLLDGQSMVTVDANGWMVLLSLPTLELKFELSTGLKVMCGDLAPSGTQIALGGEDGHVYLVNIEGFEDTPLLVTATQGTRNAATFLGRLTGRTRPITVYTFTCPSCQTPVENHTLPTQPFPCPCCKRRLRLNHRVTHLQQQ